MLHKQIQNYWFSFLLVLRVVQLFIFYASEYTGNKYTVSTDVYIRVSKVVANNNKLLTQ